MSGYDVIFGSQRRTVRLDREHRSIDLGGAAISLTPREFELMKALVDREGRVVPRAALLRKVWGSARSESARCLNVYIHALRRKIEPDPLRPRHILTVRGRGVYFEA